MVLSRDASKCWKKISAGGANMGTASQEPGERQAMHIRPVRDTDPSRSSGDGMTASQRVFRLNQDWPCILMLVYANDKESFKSHSPGKPACPVQPSNSPFQGWPRISNRSVPLFYFTRCHVQIAFVLICFP